MIIVTIDHSYEEDYFMISDIVVNIADKDEKTRIIERFNRIQGDLIFPDSELNQRIANVLEVDIDLIELDTNEMDIY